MRNKLLSGTACAALCLFAFSGAARSATLEDVIARLDALERNNTKLARENAELRNTVKQMGAPRPAVAVAVSPDKGNPVQHAAVAPSPAPERAIVSIGGTPIYSKVPGNNPFIDNTTVTLYGHVDVSADHRYQLVARGPAATRCRASRGGGGRRVGVVRALHGAARIQAARSALIGQCDGAAGE